MELPMQRRVLPDVQLPAAFIQLLRERLEVLEFGRTRHDRGAHGGLHLERLADNEVAGDVFR
jgi:hypothetical protein